MKSPLDIHLTVYQNEQELLNALWKDEHTACTCLFKRFSEPLYALAYRLTADQDEADDVVQESFIQACHHIKTFEGKSSLGTWLHRITYNVALMHHRRKELPTVRIEAGEGEEQSPYRDFFVDEGKTPDQTVLSTELRGVIHQAVLSLPETLRSALLLRTVEGLSTKEAARQLGIEEAALKVRLHRARREVRTRVARYEKSLSAG